MLSCSARAINSNTQELIPHYNQQMNYSIAAFLGLLFTFSACQIKASNTSDINIILISADDLGWSDIGCYGSEIKTPNLDKLASQGMRFTQFHNTAKCFPSRACLLTGVYAQDCGYSKTHTNPITHAVTIGEVLQDNGYLTYWSGKHHGKENPYTRGFDHFYGLKDGCCNYFNPGEQKEGQKKPAHKAVRQWCIDSVSYYPYTPDEEDYYTTDYFTNHALDFIREGHQKDQPFFLNMAYTAPHDPLMAWPEDIKKYEDIYDVGYQKIREQRYQKQLSLGLIDESYTLSAPTHQAWEKLSSEKQQFEAQKMAVYAAMIDRMDQNIGRLIEELKRLNELQNTLILFVSDNGASSEVVNLKDDNDTAVPGSMDRWLSLGKDWANVCNTPFRFYKSYSYEGGINTPLIAWWPEAIEAQSFSQFRGHFIDILPTLIDITGAAYPKTFKGESITPLRGESLLPVFKGENVKRETPLFWQWRKGSAMVSNHWKIVKHGPNAPWDLYNLSQDPTEKTNLASEHPEKVLELDRLYKTWHAQYE